MPDASSTSLIQCVNLSKTFKDFWMRDRVRAVDDIDLDVRRGEVFGLLGPNGSGKSTTIKMILGLLHPTAGRIAVFGKPPRDTANKERIGYLPEETYLYRFLDARETLEYYGKLFHQDRATRRRRIEMLLEMVGLDKVARRPIGEYSKGMQRRIGLAQALINDPELLILDEPTTGLDPIGTRQIKDLIRTLRDAGKTVLLCSHLLGDVEDVTDRCAIMFGGKVRRSGTIDELLTSDQRTEIEAPALDEAQREAVVAALEGRGIHDVRVRPGRQRLESLFLDIVHQAQAEGVATTGAGNAGRVAEFLRERNSAAAVVAGGAVAATGGDTGDASDTPGVLETLTVEEAPEPLARREPVVPSPEDLTAASDDVLGDLVTPAAPAAPSAEPVSPPVTPTEADLVEPPVLPERPPVQTPADREAKKQTPEKAPDTSVLDDLL